MRKHSFLASILVLTGVFAAAQVQAQSDSSTTPSATAADQNAVKKPAVKKKKPAKAKKADLKASPDTDAKQMPNVAPDTMTPAAPPAAAQAPSDTKTTSPTTNVEANKTQAEEDEIKNNRAKTLEGSKSPLSVQAQLSYSGSSVKHPFSENAPNPQGDLQTPVVQLGGTVAARYRLDKKTTAGVGIGLQLDKPFQDPSNFSLSSPNIDLAHSFKSLGIDHRTDIGFNIYTDTQYRDAGYRTGFWISDDFAKHWDSGFTLGFVLEVDVNTFGGSKAQTSQSNWALITDPYVEYQLTEKLNIRSVMGINAKHVRAEDRLFTMRKLRIYETLGLGIAATDWLFLYAFVEFTPFSQFTTDNSIVGFSAIINIF